MGKMSWYPTHIIKGTKVLEVNTIWEGRYTLYLLMNLPKCKKDPDLCSYGVLSRHFILSSLALKQRLGATRNWKRGGVAQTRTRARCIVRPASLIKPQTLLTCFSQSNGGTWTDCTDKSLTWFYEVDSSLAFSWPLQGLENYYSTRKISARIIRHNIEQDQEPLT